MGIKERALKAFRATRGLGIPDEEVKPVLHDLLEVYGYNWEPIEAEDYRALIDAYFEFKENQGVEDETEDNMENDGSKRPSKKLQCEGQEDHVSSAITNSSKTLALKKATVPLNTDTQEIMESSQRCSMDRRIEFSSQPPDMQLNSESKDVISSHLPSTDRKSTHDRVSRAVYFKRPLDAHGSSHTSKENGPTSHCNRKLIKPKNEQLIGDMACGESFPARRLKKRASGIGNSGRDLNEKGKNCSGILNSSNLVNNQRQTVASDQKRLFLSISDITKGAENVKISLVNEFGKEDLPKFNYMPHNTIYQNAYVHISLARISDEDCCSSCSGDCLSLSIPCACARETGGEFAYTQQGLLKEEFLDACMSIESGVHDRHLVYCQDCPLERSKNEYFPEQCKGHIIRKFIKECWRKCGCNMHCGNRVVQRGITCELQVFLTRGGKGWGLRTLQDLPKGTFVCEYVGEILTNTELYERNMQSSGSERHTYPVTLDADWGSEKVLRDEEALCLDATFFGNVARFINHRCFDANLTDIPVEVETPDRHYYHLALFTARKVNALEELTWDYGIDFSDHNHPIKAFTCCCGSAVCRDMKRKS
ncbi:hypothetical protein ACOSQ2_014899 [Xanthoceras sorbifolium]|uniref:Histone-lysine N-methyltransferase SUVR4 n=1 Tax=Xanthoceras sorbifolium TaxID=99658 RepID=A0ABQ8I5B9_9ROSI|nr:hypothetical protein JRO89_XS04G0151400 [Xanthoceras sorbifolium]